MTHLTPQKSFLLDWNLIDINFGGPVLLLCVVARWPHRLCGVGSNSEILVSFIDIQFSVETMNFLRNEHAVL